MANVILSNTSLSENLFSCKKKNIHLFWNFQLYISGKIKLKFCKLLSTSVDLIL